MSNFRKLLTLAALALAVLFQAPMTSAGCGCDHPPAPWTLVMPPFASPGKQVSIFADSGKFQPGETYTVDFGGSAFVEVVASEPGRLRVPVPEKAGEDPGPKALKVQGPGYDREYARELFTALPPAPVVPATGGSFAIRKLFTAVADDGTLFLPLHVGNLLDATQLAFQLTNLPLAFGPYDVTIFNADGMDLTLFTLEVGDLVHRQWGEYYGWRVEDDTGLHGDFFDPAVLSSSDHLQTSNVLAYWRHEFHTYAAAHGAGGTHQVDQDGLHPDASVHVDHDRIVIAIQPLRRNSSDPADLSPLDGGKLEMDLVMIARGAAGPLDRLEIGRAMTNAVAWSIDTRSSGPEQLLVRVDPH